MKSFTYGNGITFAQSITARGQPSMRSDMNGAQVILKYSYAYDNNGNLTRLTDTLGDATRSMTYDDLDRLVGVEASASWPTYEGASTYSYDAADNIRSWTITPLGNPTTYSYSYDGAHNRLASMSGGGTSAQYDYDDAGRMIQRGVISQQSGHTWDGLGQMLRAYGTARIGGSYYEQYAYDAFGHRTVSTDYYTGKKRYDVWSQGGQRLYSEDQWDGKKHRFIYLNGRLVAEVKTTLSNGATETLYHHTDALGSATSITRTNRTKVNQGNGGIDTIRTAYGRIIVGQEANGPGYAGHLGDRASDLTYMKARYYDNMAMRFISTDPVDVDAATGANFNRYWYANNNPYRFVDPDGRLPVDTFVDLGYVVWDTGNFLGASAAATVGWISGDDTLVSTGLQGMRDTGSDLALDIGSVVTPYASAPMVRGIVKGTDDVVDAAKSAAKALEKTPSTHPDLFKNVRGCKGKCNSETGEVWEKDMLHKDQPHYEVYKNKKDYEKRKRSRAVWEDGRKKEEFKQ